jgi:hypothetical protein
VVTKVDALNLEFEIGSVAAQSVMSANPSITSEGDAINMLVRNFLAQNDLDHFVRDIELQFSNVRYFSCSALGRLPVAGDNSAFMPTRVADPLIWLLSRAKAIETIQENGRATRFLGPQTQVQTQTMPFQRN